MYLKDLVAQEFPEAVWAAENELKTMKPEEARLIPLKDTSSRSKAWEEERSVLSALVYDAWSVIADVGLHQGRWDVQHPEWVEAAVRWRNQFHRYIEGSHIPTATENTMPQVPSIGRVVLTTVDPALNNGSAIAPAIVTRVFDQHPSGGWVVNLRALSDSPIVPWLTSVQLLDVAPASPEVAERHTCWWPPRVV